VKRPELFRSIRFRLTVIYSTLLFALAGAALAITYFAVAYTTDAAPLTTTQAKLFEDRVYQGQVPYADISQIEAAINYDTLRYLRNYSLIALAALFVAGLGIGWVLSGRVLRPVGAIARTAREIQATDLSRRIELGGPRDELRDLADTIDSMLDRLDDAFQSQRQLIDDASHELRSPLAIIRTNLDASLTPAEASPEERERAVAVVDRATTRMSRLVEDLLSNAVRLAPGSSTVTVATGRTASWLWLAVADEGPGIAPEDLPRVFDRFWRGKPESGPERSRQRRTGLGLAIVRQIVESHGGQVAAFSELGKGSTFVLWLPAADRTDTEAPPTVSPWP
jgi:signal transduction histidine kinase